MQQTPALLPPLTEKPSRSETTRHDLLNAALHLLREVGPEKLSLRQVAKQAGVSAMASYRYFASKEALLAELARLGFLALGQTVRRPTGSHLQSHSIQAFREMCFAYAGFAATHTAVYRLMFSGLIPNHEEHPDLERDAKWSFEIVIDAARTMQDQGLFRAGPPLSLAYHIWSFLHGYLSLYLDRAMLSDTETALEQRLALQIDLLLDGLTLRKDSPRA